MSYCWVLGFAWRFTGCRSAGSPTCSLLLDADTMRMHLWVGPALRQVLNAQPKGAPPVEIWCSNVSVKAISSLLKMGSPAFNRQLYQAWKVRAFHHDRAVSSERDALRCSGVRMFLFSRKLSSSIVRCSSLSVDVIDSGAGGGVFAAWRAARAAGARHHG